MLFPFYSQKNHAIFTNISQLYHAFDFLLFARKTLYHSYRTKRIPKKLRNYFNSNVNNEGLTLQASVEAYYQRYGYYPESVLADQIYRNRENRNYCKKLGIQLSGPKLGRPSKEDPKENRDVAHQDMSERNAVEGKFGEGKQRYGLGLICARLKTTSETVIVLQLLVMNLETRLRVSLCSFFIIFC